MARGVTPQEASQALADAGTNKLARYTAHIQGKGNTWLTRFTASSDAIKAGLQRVIAGNLAIEGARKAGPGRYDRAATDKAPNAWQLGMADAGTTWLAKISRFLPLWTQALATAPGGRRSAANRRRIEENMKRFEDAAGKAA